MIFCWMKFALGTFTFHFIEIHDFSGRFPFFSLNSTSTDYDLNLNLRQHGKFTTTADGWPHQQCLDTENVAVSTSRMVWMLSLLQCMEINIQKAVWMMTPLYFIWMLTAMQLLDIGRYVHSGSCLHLIVGPTGCPTVSDLNRYTWLPTAEVM